MYKGFEQAQEEVEKLRQELYPNLYASQEGTEDSSGLSNLQTIAEDTNELTDTNNEFTEDTSEAYASDDDVRGGENNEDEDMENEDDLNTDNEDGLDEVSFLSLINLYPQDLIITEQKTFFSAGIAYRR